MAIAFISIITGNLIGLCLGMEILSYDAWTVIAIMFCVCSLTVYLERRYIKR